ncbi:UDP-glucose 4-epimerase GalE [Lysobacter oculi]|uniref:UDP-glucose 4-epimerase n=1 Tax=Solilutibacter oculi TaxID=2698682 RepID=A0A344J6P9_9GAMM|nr:UDP-glucose 4-epimerase GalE [Lysobacter oculi]AXA84709.1 UDP-glucose 4-epimerase GalE [Lysobacter oculi]
MNILVCGGAGYIGSHMSNALVDAGHDLVVLDNLSTGHAESVSGIELIVGDIADEAAMTKLLAERRFDAVMHFCASSLVGESVRDPLKYYRNNTAATLNLLSAMRDAGVGKLVFSSTAAVYGIPCSDLIDEAHPCKPINPYGTSKLFVERILADAAEAHGMRSVSLRYFNAAGASPRHRIGESHQPETHLIPNVMRAALEQGTPVSVFGSDYETRDGTCIRDFVHVDDLADAHLRAIDHMHANEGSHVFNLGSGQGYSVLEVIESVSRVTGVQVPVRYDRRRPGDPPVLVAASERARSDLGWQPRYVRIDDIVATAWEWHRAPAF